MHGTVARTRRGFVVTVQDPTPEATLLLNVFGNIVRVHTNKAVTWAIHRDKPNKPIWTIFSQFTDITR